MTPLLSALPRTSAYQIEFLEVSSFQEDLSEIAAVGAARMSWSVRGTTSLDHNAQVTEVIISVKGVAFQIADSTTHATTIPSRAQQSLDAFYKQGLR